MPARQRGFARKRGQRWLAGWHENGKQRTRGGFETRTAALDYANGKADEAVARANAIRFGDPLPAQTLPVGTVEELVEAFLARHRVDEATLRKLRSQLRHATDAFGERQLETLQPIELDVWRSQLPALSAHYIFRAFRQVLEYALAMGLLERNPTAQIKNVRASGRCPPRLAPVRVLGAGRGDRGRTRPALRGDPTSARRHGLAPRGAIRTRTPRPRPRGWHPQHRARLLAAPLEGLQKVEPPAKARAAASTRRADAAHASPAPRHAAPVPGSERRLHRRREVPPSRMGARTPSGRHRASPRVRLSPHVRVLGDRRRRTTVLPRADHGDLGRSDRCDLWAPAARQRGVPARAA